MLVWQKSVLLLCSILVLLAPALTRAADLNLERTLQNNLHKSRVLLVRIERAMLAGESSSGPLAELKELGESIRSDHQAFLARLDARVDQLQALGANGASRHAAVREHYAQSLARYLAALAELNSQQATLAAIRELRVILAEILPEKKLPIHGSVPYRHLNLPAQIPKGTPAIVPAYKGGSTDLAGADLEASPEAPISLAIAELAESLEWNPVLIYEWVKNNIQTEWYWGAMKGAEETLRQKSGNDADQATLLVALFRFAGFPARYVRGVMEFADIESAREQTGLQDPATIGRLLQKAGIPYAPVVSGGRISNFRIEHVWAEVEIPYDNYRGVMLDEHGPAWLALDTSIKVAGYAQNDPGDTVQALDFSVIRDNYLAGPKSETPLAYLAAQLDAQLVRTDPGLSYASLLRTRSINPEQMQIIPAGLQFTEVAITGEYASLPEDLLHWARFIARAGDVIFFDQPLPVYRLAGRSIAVRFEPETIEDQEIINAYGGLDNTPSYLIRLRPVLTIGGKRELVGRGGLAAGSEFSLAVELVAPAATVQVENTLIAGYPTQIGLCAQQAVLPAAVPLAQQNAERLLFERAMSYLDQGNRAEEELGSLLQLQLARPLPTLVTLGGVLDVVTLLDAPHGFTWQGLYLDADLRVTEPVGGLAPAGMTPAARFMQLAGLQHSFLEHRIFEEGFGVEAVSTVKALALARLQNIPLAQIDATNIATLLPTLNLPETIIADISNGVHQGYHVTLPECELAHEDWTGYAYLKENPATFESGWMLAGEIAGGMTAWNPSLWPEEYREIMTHPGTDSSGDPASAAEIKVIRGLDSLTGTAGEQLKTPLQIIAQDAAGKPVRGVEVRFAIKAGGAKVSRRYFASWQQDLLVQTDYDGIARVDVLFDKSTDINPTTARRSTDKASQRVDETVIEVTTTSGLRTAAPASVFGFPDAPHHLQVTGGNTSGPILTWAATLIAAVEDQYNNPRSGEQVEFIMGAARPGSACGSETSTRPGLLIDAEDPCVGNIPVYGQCGSTSVTGTTGLHLGAAAHVLLGDRPAAEYPVTITSGALSEQVTVTSSPAGPCDPEDAPYSALVLRVIHDTDAQGNIITAGPVSTDQEPSTIPLLARLYAIQEQGTEVDKDIPCLPSGTDTCPIWQGTGVYAIDTDFVSASVQFDGTAAEPLGNGLYRVNYPLASSPQKHEIKVTGNATDKEKINVHICDERNGGCQLIEVDKPIDPVSHATTAYAVAVTVPREHHIIPVNEAGYVTADYPLTYTIEPPEYTAATADVVLSEKNDEGALEEIAYFGAETSGQGGMTFLTGFRFDQNKKYQAQVVLNEGSESMEIRSKAMTLQPLTLELDADLNRDGVWKEDDPLEHTAPGLIIPLNLDDDDSDDVPDHIDGSDADGISGNADDAMNNTNGEPVADDDLAPVRLSGLPADLTEGSVILEVVQGHGKIRVWADSKKGKENILIDFPATGVAAKTWTLGQNNDLASLSELPGLLYVEGVNGSTAPDDTAIFVTKYISPQGNEVEMDRLQVTVINFELISDLNHDRKIDTIDRGLTEKNVPVWFWINDDNDPQFSEIETEGLDAPGATDSADANNNYVDGTRDLIDYFPVYLDIKAVLEMLGTENYSYILTTSQPRSLNVIFTDLVAENAGDFLTDTATAHGITQLEPLVIDEEGVELSEAFLDGIRTENKGIILLEARDEKSTELVLSIRDRMNNTLMTATLPLRISSVEDMINYIDLRGVVTEAPPAPPVFTPVPEEHTPPPELHSEKKVIFVYGYNVNVKKGRGWIAETFKRLYWSGSRAQFYGVSWQGNDTQIYIPFIGHRTLDYHGNVINALNSAESFANVVQDKVGEGDITLIGHSLGNMLCSEVLNLNPDLVSRYFMVNGAVAIEAFDGAADQRGEMVHPEWEEYSGVNERLWASEWYKLFSPENGFNNDHRFRMTWRNKFSSIISKTYNFYSSGEEVFEPLTDAQRRAWTGLISQAETDGRYSWSLQELLKGRTWINFVGSNYGGWGFNADWDIETGTDAQGNAIKRRRTPDEAELLTGDQLRQNPFFQAGGDETRGLYVPDYQDDPGTIDIGSLVAQDNHNILLAGFVPSRTLATGREQVLRLNEYASDEQRNYNLQDFQSSSPDNWPVERIGRIYDDRWLHNDIREVAYLYTYNIFDIFIEIGGN